MITRKVVVVVCLAVCWVSMAPVAVGQDAQPAENLVSAVKHFVLIKFDPTQLPLDSGFAYLPRGEAMLSWVLVHELFQRAVNRAIPEEEREEGRRYINGVEFKGFQDAGTVKSESGMVMGTLEVKFDRLVDPKIGDKLWDAVRRVLRDDLDEKSGVDRFRRPLRIRLSLRKGILRKETDQKRKQLEAELQLLGALQRDHTNSSADLLMRLNDAEKQEQRLAMDVLGAVARAAAIRERIAIVRNEIQGEKTNDAVVGHLMEIVNLRKTNVDVVQQLVRSGQSATHRDLIKAKEMLALAEVDLLRARADASHRAGTARLGKLNDELSGLVITTAEAKARRQAMTKWIENIKLKIAGALDTERDIDKYKHRPRVLQEQIDTLERLLLEAELESQQAQIDEPRGVTITVWDNR